MNQIERKIENDYFLRCPFIETLFNGMFNL